MDLFEEKLSLFAAEAQRDYTRSPDQLSYVDDHMQTLWVGFSMNYMIVRRSQDGQFVDLRPGLMFDADEFNRQRTSWLECPCNHG